MVGTKDTPGNTAAADREVDLRGMTVAAMGETPHQQHPGERHHLKTESI